MPVCVQVLHRCPDLEDAQIQQVCAEIDGVRCRFDGAPAEKRSAAALEAWLRESYTADELAALAGAQEACTARDAGAEYFVLRGEDLGSAVLQACVRQLLARLNAIAAATNVSPTSFDLLLEACLTDLTRP